MIEIKHVKVDMKFSVPLKDINAVIRDGETVSIIGGSGTGKTTLLRCICSLQKITSGEILIDGENISGIKQGKGNRKSKVGMVFQGFNLYPHMNVLENVMAPQIHVLKRDRQEAYDIAVEQLKHVGMFEKARNYADELSGGQKQRVAIARTLAMDNDIILFDEPTSALDPAMSAEVAYVIKKVAKMGKTVMVVTHDMGLARKISDRVLFLCDGIVYEEGPPEQIFENPQKEKTIDFINRTGREEILITSRYFDFPEAVRKLELFAEKNHMSADKANTLQMLFEETVMQIVLPELKDEIRIRALASFSEKKDQAELYVYSNCDHRILHGQPEDLAYLPVKIIEAKSKEFEENLPGSGSGWPHLIRMIF